MSVPQTLLTKLVGMKEDEAMSLIKEDGFLYRTVYKDGEYYIVTCDYRIDRINLSIEEGFIIKVGVG